jgi:hypothetical protein
MEMGSTVRDSRSKVWLRVWDASDRFSVHPKTEM